MCCLYAMHANELTKVECSLVKSQNALMAQSKKDMQGYARGHGWGVGLSRRRADDRKADMDGV
jgi:glutamine amidotransferase